MSRSTGRQAAGAPVTAPHAMIATPHHLATAAGHALLLRGGSAVDALIGADAVLAVVYPHWAGLGGDGFWLVHDPAAAGVRAVNASGPAAALATIDYYREHGHTAGIPRRGPLAALTVPGAVDGWRLAHERWGVVPWRVLFEAAIGHARNGVPVSRSLALWARRHAGEIRGDERLARRILAGTGTVRAGRRLVQPGLAATLARIAELGARELYEGELAGAICRGLPPESPLRAADFAGYRAAWTEPIATTYRGCTVLELPPNTQGFAALEILNLVEGYDVAALGDRDGEYFHTLAEATKLAFADRDAWLADPRFVDIPLDRLLSKAYADERRGRIRSRTALPADVEPGIPFDPAARREPAAGGDTVAFCAVDETGLMVSGIESLYLDFGSMVSAGDTGVVLQDRGSAFSLDPASANRLAPGKRPFHTLVPAMLLQDGRPYLAFGTMGGPGQPQTHAAIVTRIVDLGQDVQQAIAAPRWVAGETLGSTEPHLYLEARLDASIVRELRERGHSIRLAQPYDEVMGHAQAIRLDPATGLLEGGADPRGDGAVMGY